MKRDKKVYDLVETMNDTYNILLDGKSLEHIKLYKDSYKAMSFTTTECGYFIQTYVRHNFGMS